MTVEIIWILVFALSVAVLLYHWLVYPVLLRLIVHSASPEPPAPSDRTLPFVTIAIAAWNEELIIADKIDNCLQLDYPPDRIDVLIGSDGSEDGTDEIVNSHPDPRVRLVRIEPRSGKPTVLNQLVAEAIGELVLFTDADVLLASDALKHMASRMLDPKVGVVQSHYQRWNKDGHPAEGFFDRYETRIKSWEGRLGAMVGAYGCALLVRTIDYAPLPPDTILDDFVIGLQPFRTRRVAVYEPNALCWTKVEGQAQEFRRKVRIARGNLQAFLRNLDLLHPRYGIRSWTLWSHKALRVLSPSCLLAILAASIALGDRAVFRIILPLQAVFYLTVPLLPFVSGRLRQLLAVQYYLLMNAALLVGYVQYFFGRSAGPWCRTNRPGEMNRPKTESTSHSESQSGPRGK